MWRAGVQPSPHEFPAFPTGQSQSKQALSSERLSPGLLLSPGERVALEPTGQSEPEAFAGTYRTGAACNG